MITFKVIINDGLHFGHLYGFNGLDGNPTWILQSEFHLHMLQKHVPIRPEVGFSFLDMILEMLLDELGAPGQGICNLSVIKLEFVRC